MCMTMTERIEIITGVERRRRYSVEQKVRLVEETQRPGMSVSQVARIHGVSPSVPRLKFVHNKTEFGRRSYRRLRSRQMASGRYCGVRCIR